MYLHSKWSRVTYLNIIQKALKKIRNAILAMERRNSFPIQYFWIHTEYEIENTSEYIVIYQGT